MKTIGILLFTAGILFASVRIALNYSAQKELQTKVGSYWNLADRASTIAQKSEYIDKMVDALNNQHLDGSNAGLFYQNETTSYDANMRALKSLQQRLKEISTMSPSSFEYQTAMQQITEQEQGGAEEMLSVIKSCWYKKYHYTYWNDIIVFSFFIIQGFLIVFGLITWINKS